MSFQGYIRRLCKNGHLEEIDAYCDDEFFEGWRCQICGAEKVWESLVDITNGQYDTTLNKHKLKILKRKQITQIGSNPTDLNQYSTWIQDGYWWGNRFDGDDDETPETIKLWKAKRIDGYIELELNKPTEECVCPCCGHKRTLEFSMYKIPNSGGEKI